MVTKEENDRFVKTMLDIAEIEGKGVDGALNNVILYIRRFLTPAQVFTITELQDWTSTHLSSTCDPFDNSDTKAMRIQVTELAKTVCNIQKQNEVIRQSLADLHKHEARASYLDTIKSRIDICEKGYREIDNAFQEHIKHSITKSCIPIK